MRLAATRGRAPGKPRAKQRQGTRHRNITRGIVTEDHVVQDRPNIVAANIFKASRALNALPGSKPRLTCEKMVPQEF
ncbi:MAG TPA: hypothetical protein DHV85_09420 [Candidatus Accumulibacter sp.]|nr:hypothetical protein [Accumulibacter sp.]